MFSPSSINSQPWQFLFVSDTQTKQQLAEVSFFNEHKINNGSHVVVFTVEDDLERFEARIRTHLPETAVEYYLRRVKPLGAAAVKAWMAHQVYLSLGFFLAACGSMGIDSTPMEGIDQAAYDRILNLQGRKTLFAVTIGYRDPQDENQPSVHGKSRLPLSEVVRSL